LNSVVCSCNVQGYSQVFDIISLELFWYGGKVDPKLEGNLRRFFTENDLLQTWSKVSESCSVMCCALCHFRVRISGGRRRIFNVFLAYILKKLNQFCQVTNIVYQITYGSFRICCGRCMQTTRF